MKNLLFDDYKLGRIKLNSRMVMAPLTRCRAIGNTPNLLMAEYYKQRASAGLIIAEGTSPSPNGLGYRNIPGLFTQEHKKGWEKIAETVNSVNGKIFIQLMHTGRVGHTNNLPERAKLFGPSAIAQPGEISTYDLGKQPYPEPVEMSKDDIQRTIKEYVESSSLAIESGLNGVEIHCAHGYLPNQFINSASNQRDEEYGGSIENRCLFVLEVLKECCDVIGADRVGLRISPFSYADVNETDEVIQQTYKYLVNKLNDLGLAYLHLSHMGDPTTKKFELFNEIRKLYNGTLIKCGDYTKESAIEALENNECDLIAFGRDYIANPDLVERFKNDWPLTERDNSLWYGDGRAGYTDYPIYKENG
jgi:N-ethylmaleimide reductase